jgi:hypothetical protein
MWYVVIVGAIINIGLVWLFEMKFVTQLFLGGLLAFFLGTLILLIAVLDRPYRSREFGREPSATAVWAGEGLIYLQTKVSGHGKVVVTTRGPVEETVLGEEGKVTAEGKHVICRTGDVAFKMERSTKNYLGRFTSGEGYVRVYEGAGRVLLNPAPYWRYRIAAERGKESDYPARATS